MPSMHDELLKVAMGLTENERLALAQALMESVPEDLELWSSDDEGFLEELDRRAAEPGPGVPWEVVRDELRGKTPS